MSNSIIPNNPRNPVKAAAKLAIKASPDEVKKAADEHFQSTRALERLDVLAEDLLPVERGALQAIRTKRTEIEVRLKQLQSDKLGRYAAFKLDPLGWVDKQGFPRLAVYSLDSPNFEISVTGRKDTWGDNRTKWNSSISPKLPKGMQDAYAGAVKAVETLAKANKKSIHLRTSFPGLIPSDVRQQIVEAKREFKELFLVAEVAKWDLKEFEIKSPPRPRRDPVRAQSYDPDPLVVGFDGTNYWLVTAFDMTELEQYVQLVNGSMAIAKK